MLEQDTYRQLATLNELIVETRELLRRQKALVLALADLPEGEDAVRHLRRLQGSLRELTYRRSMLVRELVRSPPWRLTGTDGHLHAGSARMSGAALRDPRRHLLNLPRSAGATVAAAQSLLAPTVG